ncbi:hypothetical protein E4T50_12126 [Aureobasidium sp. EXF-12298]|nr:hypothetical protein E4T50_12126 [Aureobasidium sp. EXF-12298]
MRFSILIITSAAVAAVATNAIETAGKFDSFTSADWSPNLIAEVPGYHPIPIAATNKYSHHVPGPIPDFATGSFEPTYMPEEDLHPNGVHARSVTSASTTAKPTSAAEEPADGSYEAFVQWMKTRIGQAAFETAENSHVARSVAPSPSAKAEIADKPADDAYEAFKNWIEALYPGEIPEETKQKLHARGTSTPAHVTQTTHVTTATAGPADGSYEAFKHWMKIRYPHGIPQEDEIKNVARSLDENEDTTSEEYHELNARSAEDHVQQELDWSQYWPKEQEEHLHARSAEDEDHEYDSEHGAPIEARSEPEGDFSYGGTFEEFLARQSISPEEFAQAGEPAESHVEEPQPQAPVEAVPVVSEVAASPAAAPTPKPTSAVTSSATTSTSASQWTGETATASSGTAATNVQARSVSSHYRFRHHSAHASDSGTATASSATSSTTTTSRKGFFNLPW